jgi:hypothetical protein
MYRKTCTGWCSQYLGLVRLGHTGWRSMYRKTCTLYRVVLIVFGVRPHGVEIHVQEDMYFVQGGAYSIWDWLG